MPRPYIQQPNARAGLTLQSDNVGRGMPRPYIQQPCARDLVTLQSDKAGRYSPPRFHHPARMVRRIGERPRTRTQRCL